MTLLNVSSNINMQFQSFFIFMVVFCFYGE